MSEKIQFQPQPPVEVTAQAAIALAAQISAQHHKKIQAEEIAKRTEAWMDTTDNDSRKAFAEFDSINHGISKAAYNATKQYKRRGLVQPSARMRAQSSHDEALYSEALSDQAVEAEAERTKLKKMSMQELAKKMGAYELDGDVTTSKDLEDILNDKISSLFDNEDRKEPLGEWNKDEIRRDDQNHPLDPRDALKARMLKIKDAYKESDEAMQAQAENDAQLQTQRGENEKITGPSEVVASKSKTEAVFEADVPETSTEVPTTDKDEDVAMVPPPTTETVDPTNEETSSDVIPMAPRPKTEISSNGTEELSQYVSGATRVESNQSNNGRKKLEVGISWTDDLGYNYRVKSIDSNGSAIVERYITRDYKKLRGGTKKAEFRDIIFKADISDLEADLNRPDDSIPAKAFKNVLDRAKKTEKSEASKSDTDITEQLPAVDRASAKNAEINEARVKARRSRSARSIGKSIMGKVTSISVPELLKQGLRPSAERSTDKPKKPEDYLTRNYTDPDSGIVYEATKVDDDGNLVISSTLKDNPDTRFSDRTISPVEFQRELDDFRDRMAVERATDQQLAASNRS